jgi:hypothetical protein
MVPKDFINNSLVLRFIMARSNTPKSYKCGECGTLGHNKRTCPALGLAKEKPVKKPRAKKAAAEAETVAPVATVEVPVVTEVDEAEARDLLAQIEALSEEPVAEVDAADVEEAFDAEEEDREPTDAELAEIEAEDEAEALALLAEIEALAG